MPVIFLVQIYCAYTKLKTSDMSGPFHMNVGWNSLTIQKIIITCLQASNIHLQISVLRYSVVSLVAFWIHFNKNFWFWPGQYFVLVHGQYFVLVHDKWLSYGECLLRLFFFLKRGIIKWQQFLSMNLFRIEYIKAHYFIIFL